MNTKNTFVKKLTALVLCLCMVLPMVTTGFAPMMALLDTLAPQADAAVTEKGKVAFYVPEVIYLYPNATSWRDATSTPFQYYIENTVNTSDIYAQPTTNTVLRKGGTIYFAAENGFSDVSITHRFMDESFNTITGGSITVGSFSNSSSYGTFSITDGKSPSLSATTTGCYIEWTVSYTNSAGERQSAIAYSYVYKPYTVPYGGVVWTQNNNAFWGSMQTKAHQMTWVSGVHSVTAATEKHKEWAYPRFGSGKSMAGFLSSDPVGYVGDTKYSNGTLSTDIRRGVSGVTYNSGASDMYAVFSNSGYFYDLTSSSQNYDCWDWFNSSNSGTYSINSFDHMAREASDTFETVHLNVSSKGYLYIDTSRYSNLNQIPNLGVALMATNDESSAEGSWYVADATDSGYAATSGGFTDGDEGTNARYFYNDHGTVMASAGGVDENSMGAGAIYEVQGRKYSGTWVRKLDKDVTNRTYIVKGYYGNHDGGEYAITHVLIHMDATQYNKSTLRAAVNNALASFGTLGVTAGYNGHYLGSYYYDVNSAAWQRFENAYKAAYLGLTKLDGAVDVATLTNNLNNAVTALKNGQGRIIYFDVNYGGIKPNLYILPTGSVTSNGVTTTVNKNTDSVSFSGTSTASAYPFNTQFTPVAGTYTYSGSIISGSFNGKGCTVLEAHTAAGQQLGNRLKVDISGSSYVSSAAVSATDAPNVKTTNLWVWHSSEGAGTYNNLTVQYKIEAGGTNTAYSPTARVAPSNTGVTTGSYGELPVPTRPGYTFAGWYQEPACTNKIESSTTVSSTTVYAKWTPNEQTLTIDTDGGVNGGNLLYNPNGLTSWREGDDSYVSANITIDENGVDISGNYTGGAAERVETLDLWVYLEDGKTYEYSFTSTNTISEFYLFPEGEVGNHANIKTRIGTNYRGVFTCGEAGGNIGESSWTGLSNATAHYQIRLDQNCGEISATGVNSYEISDFVIKEVSPDATSIYKQPTDSTMYLPDPVRGGYTFNGWEGLTNGTLNGTTFRFGVAPDTIKAKWIPINYTLTLNADGGTFDYNGSAVSSAAIPYTADSTYTLPEPTKSGYEFAGWKITVPDGSWLADGICQIGDSLNAMYGNATLTAMWEALEVDYTVEHYQMNLDGSTYQRVDTDELSGEVDTNAVFAEKSYEGFTYSHAEVNGATITSATIAGDGSLVIKLYYTRNKYTVTAKAGTGISSVTGAGEYYYGASVSLNAVVKDGYTFTNWTKDGTNDANTSTSFSFTMGAGNVAWTANANPTDVAYKVIHLREDLNGAYTIEETENLTAQVDTSVTPAVKNYTGFTAPATQTVTVAGDGSTVVTYEYERKYYDFTVIIDGVSTTSVYKFEAAVTSPTDPTKTGYTFAGWDGTVPTTMPANDVTVTAKWTINSYTVTYKVNNEVVKTETYEYAAAITPYTYTKTGYSVSAWTGESYTTMPAKNLEYTATATIINYYITYDLQGGKYVDESGIELTNPNPGNYNVETATFTLVNPTKQGYTFAGWTGTGLSSATNPVTISTGSTENRSYTATWTPAQNTYTIETYTMDTAGNYGAAVKTTGTGLTGETATITPESKEGFTVDASSVLSGTIAADGSLVLKVYYKRNQFTLTVTAGTGVSTVSGGGSYYYGALLNMTATLKDGYQTVVWSDGTTTYTPGTSTMPNKALTLTATATAEAYTIIYDLAGGTVAGTNPTGYNVESDSFTLINPTKNGYDFLGWTGTDLDAASKTVTVAKGSTGDRAYTATWAPTTYTIIYNYDGGSVATANPTTYNIESADITLTIPTKQGYAFAGWTGTGITGTADSVTIATGSTGNRTYTATWTESDANYTVNFYKEDLNADTFTKVDTKTVSSTTNKVITATTDKVDYDGFTYANAKLNDGSVVTEFTVAADGSSVINLYYTRNSHTLTYYITKGENETAVPHKAFENVEFGATIPTVADPVRTGYSFQGWKDIDTIPTMPDQDVDILALWDPNVFTISYELDGGAFAADAVVPEKHTYDTTTPIPNPEKLGYDFAGWKTGDKELGKSYTVKENDFTADFTLTATWTANPTTYTVETYLMGTDGQYPTTATKSEQKNTVTDAKITAAHETMTGFTADADKSVLEIANAAFDGSSVLKLYYSRNQYTLTLEKGTGIAEVTGAKEYYYQAFVTIDASLTAGYDWAKWTKGDAEFAPAKNHTFPMPAEALTLTANAKLHTYNINIDLASGAFAADYTAPTTYQVTNEDIEIPDPTRNGYTFNGWLVNGATAPQKDYTIDTALAVDVTLVADWTAIEYKITYVLGGGTNAATNPDTYTIESAEIKLADPTKTGYEFIKWTEGDTIAAGSTGDKTFTAEWKALGVEYNIVTHFEGFTADNYDSFENTKGSADADGTVQINDIAVAQTGFTFKEAKLTEGGEVVTEFKNGTTDGAVTVHLYYTRNSYTVTFDTDGGDAVEAQTYKYGAEVTLPATLSKTGYTFAGWDKEITSMPAENVTVTAQWTINQYTVTFANTGDSTIEPITQDYNTAITAPADPTRVGYTFAGWDKEIPATMPAENVTVTAQWTINQYTVTFDTDGGTEIAPITQNFGTEITKPADPTKTGYTFAGWDTEIPEKMPAENVTVKAQWTINQYTVTFADTGDSTIDAITADYGTVIDKPADPTKVGYTFTGWDVEIPDTMPAENMTITATWKINKYTVTFDTDGGSEVSAITQDYNTAITAPSDPTRAGYTFAGWTPAVPTVMPAENVTVKAQWTIVNYNISYELNGGVNADTNPDTYTVEDEVNLAAPTKVGYTFAGWSDNGIIGKGSTGDKTFTASWTPNQNTPITVNYYIQPVKVNAEQSEYTLYSTDSKQVGTSDADREVTPIEIAGFKTPDKQTKKVNADGTTVFDFYYTRNEYTVTFDTDGGSAIGSITALYEADITAPTAPTKTGYTFGGWTPALEAKMPLGGQTVKAVWTANSYKVSYDYNVPENVTVTHSGNVPEAHIYGTATPVADPERAGYTFAGWTVNGSAGGTNLTLAADGYTADITLKANWTADKQKYTVVYYDENLNGEYVEVNRTTENEAETDSTVTLTPAETKTGFTLNTEMSVLSGIVPVPGTTLELSVYYSRNTYKLTWSVEGVATTESYKYEQTINYPENPTKTGYNFVGWNPSNVTTMPAEDITLTAQFAAADDTAYTVIHKLEDLNADTYFEKETELKYGTTASEVTPEVKSYEGFTAPTTQTVTIAADGSTVVEYLYKRNSYDVTIVAADAGLSNATASQKVEFEGTLNVSVTVANGYEFKGWTSNNEKVAGSNVASYTITMPASDVTLTAKAEIIKYTVSYNLDGGALADGKTNPTEFFVTTDTFTLNNPEKKGYTFLGWTGSNGTTAQTEVSVEKGTYHDLSYTAKWALIPYEIKYDLAGGSVAQANATQYYVTTATFTLNNPTRAGYTFTGWTGTDLNGNVETVTITTGSIGDRSYTATWKANDIKTVVNYYWQNIDDDGYTLKETVNGTVKNDTVFAPKVETYKGFVSPEAQSVKVENGVAVTIDYKYDRETHTVTLAAGTGIASVSGADTYRYGKEITVSAVVSTGYTWQNWTADGTEASAAQNYTITIGTADVALTANATLDTYTITYSGLDQYTTVTENPTSYNVHSEEITLNNPVKDGYTFTGWTGTDLAGNTMEVKIEKGSVGNREYVANWNRNTYNLTYDLANGSFAEGGSIPATYTVDDVVTLPTPVRTGYTFKGWSDGKTTAMNVTLNRATGDRHYTAVWEANGDTKYTVKHYLMGLDGQYTATAYETKVFDNGTSDADITPAVNTYAGFTSPETQTVKVNPDGSTVVEYKYSRNKYALTYYTVEGQLLQTEDLYFGATIPVAPTATRDGYTFKEWNTEIPAEMPAHAVEITALWNTVAYTVTFNANGGKEMAAISYDIEIPVTLPKAERTGYDFAGWTVTKTQGNWSDTIADNNAALEAGFWGNVTLTANWTARQDTKYVVKHMFMATDGKTYVEDESKRVEATGTSDSKVTPAVLSVTGFTSPEAQEITIAADGSTILEYQYKRNQYTLTWKIKGLDDEKLTYYYDEPVTAKADPVLAGHTFIRWSRSVPANMPAENIEIIANFDIITYKITIDYNGGKEVTNPTTYTVETDTFTLNNPTRDGYEFLGWTGTDLDGASTSVTIEKGSTGDRTYKAKWNAKNQDWFVDVYYMTTKGDYSAAPEVLEKSNTTDTKVSFDSKDKLKDGFTFDEANSSISGTVPGTGTLRLTAKYSRNQYTVTYDFANGTADKVVTTYYEAELAAVTDPVRTGYTFAGWYDADGNKVDALPETMPLEGGTYTARWTADNYQLTLVENGGTAVEDISYDIEDTVTLPVLTRDGYFFQGWKVTAENGNWLATDANYAAGTPVSGKYGSATLTAQWTTVQYTLTFDTKGGTVSEASLSYTIEEDKQLPTPVRPGYTFNGWKVTEVSNIANDSGNVSWVVGNTYKAAISVLNTYGNATFEAQWSANTYTVSNDTANITYEGETTATVDVNYTATLTPHAGYTLPDSITVTIGGEEAIVNTAYTYTRNADGTATITINGAYIIGDIAIKVERNIVTYNISYNLNNATTDPKNATTYNVETAVTLTAPERTGYTFLGWTGSNGTTAQTEVTIPVGSTGDKNYVANWQADPRKYTVEIYYMTTDGTYNTTPDKSWTVDSVTDAQVSYSINDPATLLTGFSANESISTLTGTVPATGALTLVAKYDRNKYALTVNGCEGITAATGTVEYFYDKEIVVDATVAMGYTWVEWKSADENALAGSTDKKYTFKMPANAAELTAVATLDVYDIDYDLAGGTLADGVTNPATYTVTTDTFTLNNPTKVGYDFIGWTGTDLATPTVNVTIAKNSTTGDKSYTANWKAIEYTVSYDLDEGTAQGNNYTVYTIETAAQTLTAPVKTGYTFLGWTGSNGTEPETDVTIAGGTIGDLSFTANWSADAHTYTVEYRTQTTEGVYAEQPDKTETITSYTDAEVSVAITPEEGFYIADTSILSGTVKHDNSLVLKVYIGRHQYDVTLVDGGDGISSVNTNTTKVYFDAPVEVNAVVEKGYTFEKWTSADTAVLAGSENNPYTFRMPAGNITLTASATLNRYNINYTMNGGTNNAANPTTYTVLDAVNVKQPTRLGYTFTGWSGSYYGKNVYIAAGNTGDINLTANWSINTYTVTYDLAGGSVDGTNPETYNVHDSFTLINPTRVGYDFAGWTGSFAGENVTVPENTTGNLTFTATWRARNDTKYTVNFYIESVNGDNTYTLSDDSYVAEYVSDKDLTVTAPAITGFATPVALTKKIAADGSTVFNFYYERNQYTYTFKAIGYEDIVKTYFYEYPITKPTDPTRAGYDFVNWNPVVVGTMPAHDVTSVAEWKAITYTIGYDLAGGNVSGNPTSYTVENGYTLVNPVRNGYEFAGWTGTGLTEPTMLVTVEKGSIGNRSYTATWTPVRYEITYDFAGGTDNGANPISYTIEDNITLVNPTKVGYTFAGWRGTGVAGSAMVVSIRNTTGDRNYTATWRANNDTVYTVLHYQQDIGSNTYTLFETEEKTGTTMSEATPKVKTYPGFTSPSAKTVTILPDGSAKVEYYYTRNTYTIFFDSNGGSPVSSKTFAFGEELTGLETPSFLGYTFAGWTPALPETMTAGNLYVTADWKANTDTPYTVYHYFQDVDCVSYPEELMKVEYCYGETGAIVEVATWDVEGFTAPAKRSIVIAADGSRTVRYYYTRNTYTVTFVDHNDNILELQSVVYGLPATPPVLADRAPDADGHYTFAGWSEDTSFIHGYTTIKAMYTAEAHDPGADADCTNALICTKCGYEIAPANGHVPVVQTPAVEPTCTTAGNTADSVCSVCGEILSRYRIVPALGHEIGSWYVDVPATATTTGILKRVCSRCDWSETHEIPVLSDSPVVSIDITTSGSQAYVGTSYQLVTEIKPSNAVNKQVIWESSDPSIASVTADGFITSHKPGEVTFTVTTLDGLKTDSITINFFYSADHYNLLLLDLFACNLYLDGKPLDAAVGQIVRVKAGSTLAFTIDPTTDEYIDQGGYIFTANGSNVEADANGVYYIYNVHENIEITALPAIGKPEFDDDQQYDTDEVPEKSIFAKILAFFERIAEWFRNLFK